jgi:hypothetical protein
LSGWFESSASFWMNNPGYLQGHGAELAGVLRVSPPFSEPSYGRAYLAAITVGLSCVAAFGRRWRLATFCLLIVAASLLNTMGSTGIAAAIAGVAIVLTIFAVRLLAGRAVHTDDARARARVAVALTLIAATWFVLALRNVPDLAAMLDVGLLDKIDGDSPSASFRTRSNFHALDLLVDTFGMGAGIGSNRASSFAAALLSNVGLAGALLFSTAIAAVIRAYMLPVSALADRQWFALGALLGCLVAALLGIPDLNLPYLWMFVFIAWVARPGAASTQSRSAPEAARG